MQIEYKSRDLILYVKSNTHIVNLSDEMLANGWSGGQGVQWVDVAQDQRMVTYSKGLYGGVLAWGSDETADQWVALTGQQVTYNSAVMLAGGCLISTITYEHFTYQSRVNYSMGTGPLIPLDYHCSDVLYLSLRGYWTPEDELTLSGDPDAPCFFCGFVAQIPKPSTGFWLSIQTSF